MLNPARQTATDRGRAGQGLVEFALLMPILMILFMGIIEVALMFNAFVGVNRASQDAAHVASTAGNRAGADCLVLTHIESDVMVPNDPGRINWVAIELTSLSGNVPYARQRWERTGSTTCTLPDGTTTTVPYTRTVNDYPETQRCQVLAGCPAMTPARSTVDNIGVSINYRHRWATPLNAVYDFFGGGDAGWTFTQRNIFRMEPTL
jgi:Flp pilus assembly protein TadG